MFLRKIREKETTEMKNYFAENMMCCRMYGYRADDVVGVFYCGKRLEERCCI